MDTSFSTKQQIFIGLPIPGLAIKKISKAFKQYPQYIEKTVQPDDWHLTLLQLGKVENPKQYYSRLVKDMLQTYVPTVRINYVGRGLQRNQLWAYVEKSNLLQSIRTELMDRLRFMRFPIPEETKRDDYSLHIHIADLYDMSRGLGLPDAPVVTSFGVKEALIYSSAPTNEGITYRIEGAIKLSE